MPIESVARLLLDNLNSAVLLLDESLHVQYMNSSAEALLDASTQRHSGQPVSALFIGPGLADQELQEALQQGYPYTQRELLLTTAVGRDITVDCSVTPIAGGAKSLLIELHPRDRYLRIIKEEAQQQALDTSRAMVRGLAHEIKNPLGGLRGAAQLLARELPAVELHEYTDIIISEADRLRDLVDRLLGSNKLPKLAPANVHELLEHVRRLVEAEYPGFLTWVRDYDPSIPEVSVDRDQMIQALLNLVRNAVQALTNEPHPTLTLRTRTQRQFTLGNQRHRLVAQIDISDNGPGIPEALRHTLFHPMVSGRPDGSGLGLTITQNIISQHHGSIEARSEAGCTTFSLILPIVL